MDRQLEFDVCWAPRHRRKAKKKALLTERATVEMRTDDPTDAGFHDWTVRSLNALARRSRYGLPRIYQLGGNLSRVRAPAPGAAARIEALDENSLRLTLGEVCDFDEIRANHKGLDTHRVIGPPRELLQSILAMPSFDPRQFPPLEMLATAPLLGSDGRIISRPGYHHRDQVFMAPTIEIPKIPVQPTREDIDQALALLFDYYLADFPFADDASRAHALSMVLTPLARRTIQGPTPLHLSLSSTPGIGKSMLASALSLIVAGRVADPTMLRDSEEEMAKTLLSVLLAAPRFIFFDNLKKADSPTLATAIASPDCRFAGRVLGASRWAEVPALCCWLASGNNPMFSRELARRTVVVKLVADTEHPEQRTEFKIKNLIKWGMDHRADLLYASLVLCRAWVAAGKPKGQKTLGSFESWAETIGGILEVCGVGGFLENMDELATRDDHALGWGALVAEWWRQHQSGLVSVDDLYAIVAVPNSELEVAFSAILGQGFERTQKRRLGLELRKVQGRVFGSYRVEVVVGQTVRGYPFYQLLPALAPAPARTREPGDDDEPVPSTASAWEQRALGLGAALAGPGGSAAWAWEHQRDHQSLVSQSEPPF